MNIPGYPKKIIELDGIRGAACILVLIHHYFTNVFSFRLDGIPGVILDILSILFVSGVDLFFVLSGFLVGGIIIDAYKSKNFLKVFYIRRMCRIFPVYYFLILTFVIGFYLLKDLPFTNEALLKHPYPVWPYLKFIQSYFFGLENNSWPLWVAPSLSVSVEEQFYMLTPFLFLLLGARRSFFVVIAGILVAPAVRYYLLHNVSGYAAYMFFPGRMDSIFWGVLLAFALRNTKARALLHKNTKVIYLLVGLIFITLSFKIGTDYVSKFTLLAVFYTGIIWIILEKQHLGLKGIMSSKMLAKTGLISYAVYMIHQPVNCLVHGFLFNSKPIIDGWNRVGATFISLGIVYLICVVSLKYYENPIRKWGSKFNYK